MTATIAPLSLSELFLSNFPHATAINLALYIVTNQRTNKFSPDDIAELAKLIEAVNFGVKSQSVQSKLPAPGQKVLVQTNKGHVFTAFFDIKDGNPFWDVHANVGRNDLGVVINWVSLPMLPALEDTAPITMPMTTANNLEPSSEKAKFVQITSEYGLTQLIVSSNESPQVLFKYKKGCKIGDVVSGRLWSKWQDAFPPLHYIQLNAPEHIQIGKFKASELLEIKHESPQIVIIWQGKAYWTASHYPSSNTDAIKAKLNEITLMKNNK